MTARLEDLARQALAERRPEPALDAEVERVVLDVRLGDRVETVSIAVRDQRLVVVASDGPTATSPAARAALEWLTADAVRTSLLPAARRDRPVEPERGAEQGVEAALADLVAAVARVGVGAPEAPAITDALARLASASRDVEMARWIGRLRAALAARDEVVVGRLLDGSRHWIAETEPSRLVDHVLVEVGREIVDGITIASIERRHLFDLTDGRWLAEDHFRDTPASNGPCPRVVNAGLALATSSRRVRVVQYAISRMDDDVRARIEALACRRIADAYAEDVAALEPARLASVEPVSLVALGAVRDGKVEDASGDAIPFARHDDAGVVSALHDLVAAPATGARWVFGRWVEVGDEASFLPLSCGVDGRFVRLR